MINFFLKAKHWQIFSLIFGIPIALQVLMFLFFFIKLDSGTNPEITMGFYTMRIFPIIMLFYISFTFGWFWSVAIGLQKYIPKEEKLKLNKFRIFYFTPLIYFMLILIFLINLFYGISTGTNLINTEINMMFFIVPLHLFSLFCMFYILYFLSKTLKTAELKRKVSSSDYLGEFLLIWFLPIGIWVLQPKINRIANGKALLPTK